jgi:polyhydroxyalkanoate synthesis regulator phasin
MPNRKPAPQRLPEAVREAVDRTFQVTREGAETTRTRAQDAVDELVKGAEAGAEAVRDRVRGAIEERRPATSDDLRELRTELRAIGRRLDAIEERLPAPRAKRAASGSAKRSGAGSAAKRSSGGAAKRAGSATKRTSAAKRSG